MLHSKNTVAVPPGATIREQLRNRRLPQKEFALRMGLSEKHVSRLINGKVELTPAVALRLESVLGIPAGFWNNMESIYREQLARVEAESDMENDTDIAAKIPYAKLASLGWVPPTRKSKEKVENLRSFFEVAKLGLLDNLRIPGIAYRTNNSSDSSNYALAAWAQKARIEARKQSVSKININQLRNCISDIRNLTILLPAEFCPRLKNILAECGIALIFLPHINGSFLHGASFADSDHIVLGLTVRGKSADSFWFSLFHELYHIIADDINSSKSVADVREQSADLYARDILISPDDYQLFTKTDDYSKEAILAFADKINIAPGIVLGRLQKDGLLPSNRYHELKVQYRII